MEFFFENLWALWVAVGVVALIIEISTAALVSIWFVPAAILTCLVSLITDSFLIQILVFIILSVIAMIISRKVYKKYIKKDKDDVDANSKLIGKYGKTTEDTDGLNGKVLVGDIYWKARTQNDEKIPKDQSVKIVGVEGTTLIITK
ncbi:MAG: NfeD family protein [Clostridia bacterium]|nr:NfeD family protein [Clostridia bacterium]